VGSGRATGDDPDPGSANAPLWPGAVNWFTGETVVITRLHKRRPEVADLLETLLHQHRHETVYVAWDNANTHEDDEIEAVLRGAAGRLVLLDLPTYSPWLNPIERLWRQFRREVTPCELFASIEALLQATKAFFDGYNQRPDGVRSIIGAHPV
jgi:transposase